MNIENYVMKEYIEKNVKKDEKGSYILEQDLAKMEFTPSEYCFICAILKKYRIEIKLDTITKNDRSPLVKDYTYGEVKEVENRKKDNPEMSKIEYNDVDEVISADYSELDEYLDKKFIPNNIKTKQRKSKETKEIEFYPSIQLNAILKLKLSEQEVEHVICYLQERNIQVAGYASTLDSEFENYDYIRTYKSSKLPLAKSADVTLQKFKEYQKTGSRELRNELIIDNLRLVNYVAYPISINHKIDIHELEGYGYEGLIFAVEHYNPNRNTKFSTYAYSCIKGAILNGIAEINGYDEGLRNYYWKYLNYKKIIEEVEETTVEENPELLETILNCMVESGVIKKEAKKDWRQLILLKNASFASIEQPSTRQYNLMTEYEGYQENILEEAWENIEDISEPFEEKVFLNIAKETLEDVLQSLTERERKTLKLRYGLEDGRAKTLEEVGEIFVATRERIQQIEAKALRKLRHPSCRERLKGFIDYQKNKYYWL